MKALASGLLLILSFLLQSTLLARFTIGGIIPNLVIIIVASVGFLEGRKYGMTLGFIAGLIMDVFFGSVIGIYALVYMYIGFINGLFKKLLFPQDFKLPLGLIAGSDIVCGHAIYLILFIFKGQFHYGYYLRNIMLPEVVYTVVIACIIYPFIHFIFTKINNREEKVEDLIG